MDVRGGVGVGWGGVGRRGWAGGRAESAALPPGSGDGPATAPHHASIDIEVRRSDVHSLNPPGPGLIPRVPPHHHTHTLTSPTAHAIKKHLQGRASSVDQLPSDFQGHLAAQGVADQHVHAGGVAHASLVKQAQDVARRAGQRVRRRQAQCAALAVAALVHQHRLPGMAADGLPRRHQLPGQGGQVAPRAQHAVHDAHGAGVGRGPVRSTRAGDPFAVNVHRRAGEGCGRDRCAAGRARRQGGGPAGCSPQHGRAWVRHHFPIKYC